MNQTYNVEFGSTELSISGRICTGIESNNSQTTVQNAAILFRIADFSFSENLTQIYQYCQHELAYNRWLPDKILITVSNGKSLMDSILRSYFSKCNCLVTSLGTMTHLIP